MTPPSGNVYGIGTSNGDDFRLFKIAAALANLATFNALAALIPAIFNAIVFLATRNGAVIALQAAALVALACVEMETEICFHFFIEVAILIDFA